MDKKVLWVVAARSGSKSIPDKNIKILGSHPLLAYRIKSARSSAYLSDVWISTDSEDYAKIAEKYGAEAPFIRPVELATDEASSIDVVLQAMEFANSVNKKYQYIGLLEPTSPFISTNNLDEAISKLDSDKNASAIVAVKESRPNKIFVQKDDTYLTELAQNLKKNQKLGRQFFKKEITPSGGFYISKWNDFLQNKTFYNHNTLAYEVDEVGGLEIDESIDWLFANFIIENGLVNLKALFD